MREIDPVLVAVVLVAPRAGLRLPVLAGLVELLLGHTSGRQKFDDGLAHGAGLALRGMLEEEPRGLAQACPAAAQHLERLHGIDPLGFGKLYGLRAVRLELGGQLPRFLERGRMRVKIEPDPLAECPPPAPQLPARCRMGRAGMDGYKADPPRVFPFSWHAKSGDKMATKSNSKCFSL